jgi:hypothetical protein
VSAPLRVGRVGVPLTGVVATILQIGCASSYEARRAPAGDPTWPPARAQGVTVHDSWDTPGVYSSGTVRGVHAVVTPDGDFQVLGSSGVEVEGGVRWDVRLDGGDGVGVRALSWAAADSTPCLGGQRAGAILLDRAGPPEGWLSLERDVRWERPVVVRGPRVISGRFRDDPALRFAPSVVDVELEPRAPGAGPTCVRVPVVGAELAYWNRARWSLGLRFAYRRSLRFTESSTVSAGLSLGRWIGPVRVSVEGILGTTAEDRPSGDTALCSAAGGPACDTVDFDGFSIEAGGLAWRLGRSWALGWSAAIETLFARIDRHDRPTSETTSASATGPRVALQLLRAPHPLDGVAPRSPADAWGLELFVAAPLELTGAARGSQVDVGFALLTF